MDCTWICSSCGSSNPYPDTTECEVCNKKIDENEIKQAKKSLEDAVNAFNKIKHEEEAAEKLRKQEELERQRKEEYERKQREKEQLLKEKQERHEKLIKKCTSFETVFFKGFFNFSKVIKNALVCLVALGILTTGISVVKQNKMKNISRRIEKISQTVVQEFEEKHCYREKNGDISFKPFSNIKKRYEYLANQFKKSENIEKVVDLLEW